jgi:hypothetical protein
VENPEGKVILGRHRRTWKMNMKMDLTEIGRGDINWIELAQIRD